ncbi:MAG: beta-ketoacyl-[acyl-carrier-protein] synthase family protein [Planctomycetes bacterium]|nr:beta-ketoacyl-[acyl-carrier-protein] synthase family protein [Planctomycetota bacterium]
MTAHRLDPVTPRRVAITGMSVGCALGFEVDALFEGLLAGRFGIGRIRRFAPAEAGLPVEIGGEIPSEVLAEAAARYAVKDPDCATLLGMYAIGRALEDAGLATDGRAPLPYDLIVGTGHGTLHYHHVAHQAFLERGYRALRPTSVVRTMFNRLSSLGSMRFKLTGSNYVVSSACATAAVAFGDAFHRVRFGLAEGAVAAAADSGLDLPTFAAWNRLGVLSTIADPEQASRPFDRGRRGLVLGEGAAAFVLEPWETSLRRGARPRAEVIGYGSSSDAGHIVQPDPEGQARAVRAALRAAAIGPEAIDFISTHGTGTLPADAAEARAMHLALGETLALRIPASNPKAQLGHLMGATAGVELAAVVRTLETGRIPACRNLDDPDPECRLGFVRGAPLAGAVRIALKNTFAFGGNNAAVLLARADPE